MPRAVGVRWFHARWGRAWLQWPTYSASTRRSYRSPRTRTWSTHSRRRHRWLCGHRRVKAVQVDIPAKRVTVDYDEAQVGIDRIKLAVEDEEYPVAAVQ